VSLVAGDGANARPAGVSGCAEMVILAFLTKKSPICLSSEGDRSLHPSSASADKVGEISGPRAWFETGNGRSAVAATT
jgi:hypothetical protein